VKNSTTICAQPHYNANVIIKMVKKEFLLCVCLGLNGKSTNYYVYVLNNPLVLKDPTGRFLPLAVIAGRAAAPLIGAAIGAAVHVATTPWGDITYGSKNDIILLCYLCNFCPTQSSIYYFDSRHAYYGTSY